MVHVIKHLNDYVSEIRRQFQQELEPSAPKLYVKELETELAVAENTIHKTEESFQILRNITIIFKNTFPSFKISSPKTRPHFQSYTDNSDSR